MASGFSDAALAKLEANALFSFQIQDAAVRKHVDDLREMVQAARHEADHGDLMVDMVQVIEDEIESGAGTREFFLLAALQNFAQEIQTLQDMESMERMGGGGTCSMAALFAAPPPITAASVRAPTPVAASYSAPRKQKMVKDLAQKPAAPTPAPVAVPKPVPAPIAPAPVPAPANEDDDMLCGVCFMADSTDGDPIVICEMCNVAVHQTCYRIESLPEGDWLCHPCAQYLQSQDSVTPTHELVCAACDSKQNGALVPTADPATWVHMSCSMYLPELYIQRQHERQRDVIAGLDKLRPRRKLRCCFCKKTDKGACAQCAYGKCTVAYHVPCALRKGIKFAFMEDKNHFGSGCRSHHKLFLKMDGVDVNDVIAIASQPTTPMNASKPQKAAPSIPTSSTSRPKKARKASWTESDDDDDDDLDEDDEDDDVSIDVSDDELSEKKTPVKPPKPTPQSRKRPRGDNKIGLPPTPQQVVASNQQSTPTAVMQQQQQQQQRPTPMNQQKKGKRQSTLMFGSARKSESATPTHAPIRTATPTHVPIRAATPMPATPTLIPLRGPTPIPVTPTITAPVVISPTTPAPLTTGARHPILQNSLFAPLLHPESDLVSRNVEDSAMDYIMILITEKPLGLLIGLMPFARGGTYIAIDTLSSPNPLIHEAVRRGVIQQGDEVFAMNDLVLRGMSIDDVHKLVPTLQFPVRCWFRTAKRADSATRASMYASPEPTLSQADQLLDSSRKDNPVVNENEQGATISAARNAKSQAAKAASAAEEGLAVDWPWAYLRSDGKIAMNLFWRTLDSGFYYAKMNKKIFTGIQEKLEKMTGVPMDPAQAEYARVQDMLVIPKRERLPSFIVDFRKTRKQRQTFLSSDIFMGVNSKSQSQAEEVDELVPIKVGLTITVAKRTWPGINKLGGAGRIRKVHEEKLEGGKKRYLYDVAYVLGGGEKKVERKYISVVDLNNEPEQPPPVQPERVEAKEALQSTDADSEPVKLRVVLNVKKKIVPADEEDTPRLDLPIQDLPADHSLPARFHSQIKNENGMWFMEHVAKDKSKTKSEHPKEVLIHRHFDLKLSEYQAAVNANFKASVASVEERGEEDVDSEDDEEYDEPDVIKAQLEEAQAQLSNVIAYNEQAFQSIKSKVEEEYATKRYRTRALERIQWKNYEQMYRDTMEAKQQFEDSDDENDGDGEYRRKNSDNDSDSDTNEDESFGGLFVNRVKHEGHEICVLCELSGGDLAAAASGHVVHPQCAMYTPETYFKDGIVHGIDDVPAERRTLSCSICHGRKGLSKIQCSSKKCTLAFHIACAYVNGLLLQAPHYTAWCPKHMKTSGLAQHVDLPEHLEKQKRKQQQQPDRERKRKRGRPSSQAKKMRRETSAPDPLAPAAPAKVPSKASGRRKQKRASSVVDLASDQPQVDEDDDERQCARRLVIDIDSDE